MIQKKYIYKHTYNSTDLLLNLSITYGKFNYNFCTFKMKSNIKLIVNYIIIISIKSILKKYDGRKGK